MNKHFCQILVFILTFKATLLFSEGITIRNIDFPAKSDKSHITAIFQDSYGFIWIGTSENGLYRYDGYNYISFKNSEANITSISGDHILCITEDSEHNLWIGTQSGLNKYDRFNNEFIAYKFNHKNPESISHDYVSSILIDRNNRFWVGTDGGGLNQFDPVKETFLHTKHEAGDEKSISSDYVIDIVQGNGDDLWISTWDGGLNHFDINTWSFEIVEPGTNTNKSQPLSEISCLNKDSSGRLWIGTAKNGLFCYDLNSKKFHNTEALKRLRNMPQYSGIISITVANDSIVWLGTERGGIIAINQKGMVLQKYTTNTQPSIPNIYSSALYVDKSNVIWCGHWGNHVTKLIPGILKIRLLDFYSSKDSISTFVNAVIEGENNKLWLAKLDEGITGFDLKTKEIIHFNEFPANELNQKPENISCLAKDSKGKIWAGFNPGGLYLYNPKTNIVEQFFTNERATLALPNNFVNSIFLDSDNEIYVATQKGLYYLNLKENRTEIYQANPGNKKSISDNFVVSIHPESKDKLWIGTKGGLCLFDKQTKEFSSPYKNRLTNNYIVCIEKDLKGRLWVGTTNGANLIDIMNDSVKHFYQSSGIPSNFIEGIISDKRGNVWLSTRKGLALINIEKNYFRVYDEHDGISQSNFGSGSIEGKDGNIYFGGTGGIYYLNPENAAQNFTHPIPGIIKATISNRKNNSTRIIHQFPNNLIVLSPIEDQLTLEFSAFDYHQEEKNKFHFEINRMDNSHFVEKGNTLILKQLKPGKYDISINASNNDGYWSKAPLKIELLVQRPIFKKPVFVAIFVTLILGLTFFILRKRIIRYIEARNAAEDTELLERIDQIKKLMEDEKMFTKSDLTISEISRKLGVSDNIISATLNKHMKVNFYDFINEYRVEEAKKLLVSPENKNIKIVFIAYDAGFNSKATFYVAFKKATKMTPTEYRKKYLKTGE